MPGEKLKERHQLEDQFRNAAQALAAGLIAKLTPADIEQARQWTGLEFLQPSLLNSLDVERNQMEAERADLEKQPDFNQDPRMIQEQAEQERQRLMEHQAALLPMLRTCLSHPRFSQLLKAGFGTARYGYPFWRMSFYRDRTAAEELCQRTGHKSFASLLDDYNSANQAYELLENKLEMLTSAPATSRQRWKELGRRIEHAEQILLNTARTRITLALLKGGAIWTHLERADLPSECRERYYSARHLRDRQPGSAPLTAE